MKNDRLLEALKRKGWSQKELAERTGLTPSAISLYVNGLRLLGQNTIVKLCKALGVSADWLLGIEPEATGGGMYKCFHCGGTVCWDSDFDFEDYGYEGEGIVHICHCMNCGAEIEYDVPIGGREDA